MLRMRKRPGQNRSKPNKNVLKAVREAAWAETDEEAAGGPVDAHVVEEDKTLIADNY